MNVQSGGWRTIVFKNRGALLVPVALVLLVFGRPSIVSAEIGIAAAAVGELLRIWAVGFSGVTTRADIVTAPTLVTAGPYAFVRNPLYVANTIVALGFWGAFSGGVSTREAACLLAVVIALVVVVYAIIIPLEEAYLLGHFGEPYRRYCQLVPRVLPLRAGLPREQQQGTWRSSVILRAEVITLGFFALMATAVALKLDGWSGLGVYF